MIYQIDPAFALHAIISRSAFWGLINSLIYVMIYLVVRHTVSEESIPLVYTYAIYKLKNKDKSNDDKNFTRTRCAC